MEANPLRKFFIEVEISDRKSVSYLSVTLILKNVTPTVFSRVEIRFFDKTRSYSTDFRSNYCGATKLISKDLNHKIYV